MLLRVVCTLIIIILSLALSPDCAKLIAHWPLDQDSGDEVIDVVGGHHGKVVGGKALWVPGKFGNALEFKGQGHHVEVKKSDDLQLKNVTLVAWVNLQSLSGRQEIVSYADSYGTFVEGVFRGLLFTGGNWSVVSGTTSAVMNRWYQVALVVDTGALRIYVDANQEAEIATPNIAYQDVDLWFGGGPADNQFWLTGIIDEVEIWDGALKDGEIKKLFTSPPGAAVYHLDKVSITWGTIKLE